MLIYREDFWGIKCPNPICGNEELDEFKVRFCLCCSTAIRIDGVMGNLRKIRT